MALSIGEKLGHYEIVGRLALRGDPMKLHPLVALALVCLACPLLAADDDWGNLRTLRAGDRVRVIEMDGTEISGKYVNNSIATLVVDAGKAQQSIAASSIVLVTRLGRTHRVRYSIIFGIVGAVVGAGVMRFGIACAESTTGCRNTKVATAGGGAIGAALGALIPARSKTVYRVRGR